MHRQVIKIVHSGQLSARERYKKLLEHYQTAEGLDFLAAFGKIYRTFPKIHHEFLKEMEAGGNPSAGKSISREQAEMTKYQTEPEKIAADEKRSCAARYALLVEHYKAEGLDGFEARRAIIKNHPDFHRQFLQEANR